MVDQVQGLLLDLVQMCIGPGPTVLATRQISCPFRAAFLLLGKLVGLNLIISTLGRGSIGGGGLFQESLLLQEGRWR